MTKTKVSTRTKVAIAIGAVALVAAAVIGLAWRSPRDRQSPRDLRSLQNPPTPAGNLRIDGPDQLRGAAGIDGPDQNQTGNVPTTHDTGR